MKNILIIGNTGLTNSNSSTNNRMKGLFKSLSQNFNIFYYKMRQADLNVNYIEYLNLNPSNSIYSSVKEIYRNREKFNFIIAESFRGGIIAFIIYLSTRIPFIWRFFGSTFNDRIKYFSPQILFKLFLHRIISNSNGCKAIICTEDGCSNKALFIETLKVNSNKFYMVKNQRTPVCQTLDLQKKSERFIITSIGRISRWKKIDILIESIANASKINKNFKSDFRLEIIGIKQDEEYYKDLKALIEKYDLVDCVKFHFNLDLNGVNKILSRTSITVSLTAYNPIIESLQNSIPVITYEYGEVSDVFGKCEAVKIICKEFKKSYNLSKEEREKLVKELTVELINSFDNKNSLIEIGERGLKFVEKNFPTLDEQVTKASNLVTKIINNI